MAVPDRERGAALLTVLLLVAIVSILATTALERLRLSTRAAGNAAAIEQGRAYANAAETLALVRIGRLLGASPDRVTLAGGWSNRPFGLPVPGGSATARVTDGGGCFNLNGLVTRGPDGVFVVDPIARTQFARLMRLTDIPAQVAEQVASGAADWIDSDDQVQPQGAEDSAYLRGETPYRTAGTLMADPSELRAVAGVTPALYTGLRRWICTFPIAEPATLNVNTLTPEQAPLVAMLFPDTLTVDLARQALLRRPPQGFDSAAQFLNAISANGGVTPDGGGKGLGVTSRWFALRIDVALGDAAVEERALVDANRLPATLVSRQWGEQS
ncbi:type II secretion system minor pseudopilin GspK [uncultured Sphingomonas sp.]|uniref:type II secretion system minor pseudopilin GspK n=1 Tax=uncultured Sphingomonas sp. TaxID=158754 RepID=UPI0035C9C252